MFVAKNAHGELVNMLEESPPRGAYFCPSCQGRVRLKKGKKIRQHFAHVSLENCKGVSENESVEHLQNKAALFHWAKKESRVMLEQFIPQTQQIADLLVGERLALEVQCSPLSIPTLHERSQSYQAEGYHVLWLLGEKLWLREKLTRLQEDFLYFSQNMGFHLWELDQAKQVLRLKYLIHQDLRGKVHFCKQEFPFGQGSLLSILRSPFAKQAISSFFVAEDREICQYVQQQLYYRSPKWMALQAESYQNGQNLLTYQLKDWFPQVRPVQGQSFCQIHQDLSAYYQAFEAFYREKNHQDGQNLYPPAFYHQNFSKNMVE